MIYKGTIHHIELSEKYSISVKWKDRSISRFTEAQATGWFVIESKSKICSDDWGDELILSI